MDVDTVWRHVDEQRERVAGLMEGLTDEQWETASLCDGWRVREVGAHLTLAHSGVRDVLPYLVRGRGGFDAMIRLSAIDRARDPVEEFPRALRAMVGSRRTAPMVSHLEPLTDVLVHAQDMAIPLGLDLPMPPDAAAASADRVWSMGFPFWARRRFRGTRLRATDHDWEVGDGDVLEGRMQDLLLLLTGRECARERLSP
jgi:uncharacterized protein (TIGR03083 family)